MTTGQVGSTTRRVGFPALPDAFGGDERIFRVRAAEALKELLVRVESMETRVMALEREVRSM